MDELVVELQHEVQATIKAYRSDITCDETALQDVKAEGLVIQVQTNDPDSGGFLVEEFFIPVEKFIVAK
jgi:hypothetical protein